MSEVIDATKNYVQAFVVNYTYHSSFDDITEYASHLETILNNIKEGNGYMEGWTAPRWSGIGDVAFFMQAKTTAQLLSKYTKQLYDMGKTNMSYKKFLKLMPSFCWVKAEGSAVIMDNWMTYPEVEAERTYPKNSGFGETLIIENVYDLPSIEGFKTYVTFKKNPEIAVYGFEALKEYVFRHQDEISYFWTDYDLAIPTIKELVLNRDLCEKYGGKIFAIGIVNSIPEIDHEVFTGKGRRNPIFANFDHMTLLEHPIDIEEFRGYLTISRQGAITPVLGDAFERLKAAIVRKNKVPSEFENAVASPVSLASVNDDNWMVITGRYRRKFTLESQFRAYYVDRFLKVLCGNRRIFRECICYNEVRNSRPRVDNVILFRGKYLPVEVKLNVKIENDIKNQCASYCEIERCDLNAQQTVQESDMYKKVLVIDTSYVYLYNHTDNSFEVLQPLDDFKSKYDIEAFRDVLTNILYE